MKILFMGSPDFAVGSLESLLHAGYEICGVVTQPDKPKGRGYTMVPTAVKICALSHGLTVYTPQTLKDGAFLPVLEELSPDCIVVVAYGKILPETVLSYPKYGCVNIHASLLPKYRGAAPIHFALINGEKITGVTTMLMDKGIDTGDILLKAETAITASDDVERLHDRLAAMGAELIVKTLQGLENGTVHPQKQTGEACYAPLIDNSVRLLSFTDNADKIVNKIRGLSPAPAAYLNHNGKNIKIFAAEKADCPSSAASMKNGNLLSEKELIVKVQDGAVKILSLAPEGKKRMSGEEFLRGVQDKKGFGFFS